MVTPSILFNWHIQGARSNPSASPRVSPLHLLKKHHWFPLQPWDGRLWSYHLLTVYYVPGSMLDALHVLSHISHSHNYEAGMFQMFQRLRKPHLPSLPVPGTPAHPSGHFSLPVVGPLETSSASFLCTSLSVCCIFY